MESAISHGLWPQEEEEGEEDCWGVMTAISHGLRPQEEEEGEEECWGVI
jgi:hypothetical protein